MIDTIKTLILDFQQHGLDTGVPRRFRIETVPGKATVCIGVRRSGKSTYMCQLIQRLLDSGVPCRNILYVNFFDDRLHNLRSQGLGVIVEAYFSLYPEKKDTETVYCFFDEIQCVPGWETFVERIMRTEQCQVYITGSSAKMLSKEIATQMRGRALSWEIFPFSFKEYLDYREIDASYPMPTKKRLLTQKAFADFWQTGGFPEVVGIDQRLRTRIHQEYFHAVLFRDVVERHGVSHPRAVVDLAHWLVDNAASLYSINGLTGFLKSLGHKAPKSAVSSYLEWFEDAYFLFSVRLFDASLSRSKSNPKKVYCVDHAFINSVSSGILLNSGHLLENLVFTALRRLWPDIFYYRTGSSREVDFIVQMQDSSRMLIQVCESLADPQTRKREITALREAMGELKLERSMIVTRNEAEQIDIDNRCIEVLPIWRFLLSLPDAQE
ncbi:MAG: ATP-binding protein [Planctomycetes bacterium]|nr:ATP-binding protein [Planctomycetota bacterium]